MIAAALIFNPYAQSREQEGVDQPEGARYRRGSDRGFTREEQEEPGL